MNRGGRVCLFKNISDGGECMRQAFGSDFQKPLGFVRKQFHYSSNVDKSSLGFNPIALPQKHVRVLLLDITCLVTVETAKESETAMISVPIACATLFIGHLSWSFGGRCCSFDLGECSGFQMESHARLETASSVPYSTRFHETCPYNLREWLNRNLRREERSKS
eukprot:3832199-Amphidinium_carterae.1